jgi:hypothetical protein
MWNILNRNTNRRIGFGDSISDGIEMNSDDVQTKILQILDYGRGNDTLTLIW